MPKLNDQIRTYTHDLKNLLGGASGCLYLLEKSIPELTADSQYPHIKECLKRSIELTKEFALDLVVDENNTNKPLEHGFIRISAQEFISQHTKKEYTRLKEMYDLDINITIQLIEKDIKYVHINPTAAKRVRENIIQNAIDAGASRLEWDVEMREHYAVATFTDNGKGMTQETIDKIMLRLHGDGIVHGIGTTSMIDTVRNHGYHIEFSSTKGVGTIVRVVATYVD